MKRIIFKQKEKKAPGKSISLRMDHDQVVRLDKIAKKTGTVRAEIIRQSVDFALKNMEQK